MALKDSQATGRPSVCPECDPSISPAPSCAIAVRCYPQRLRVRLRLSSRLLEEPIAVPYGTCPPTRDGVMERGGKAAAEGDELAPPLPTKNCVNV